MNIPPNESRPTFKLREEMAKLKPAGNVTEINTKKADKDLVKVLERLLEYAKTGELIAMVYATEWQGNTANYGWVLRKTASMYALLGAVTTAGHDLSEFQSTKNNPEDEDAG